MARIIRIDVAASVEEEEAHDDEDVLMAVREQAVEHLLKAPKGVSESYVYKQLANLDKRMQEPDATARAWTKLPPGAS